MKRLMTTLLLLLAFVFAGGREYTLRGSLGGLETVLTLPDGFDPQSGTCPLVILMHGFWVNKDFHPLPHCDRYFHDQGYATLRFDFGGCGRSEGASTAMTVETLLADARVIYDYALSLPFVESITLWGHSQGGLVAGILAGRLALEGLAPDAVILLAPAAVIPDYAKEGRFFGITCDPADPAESINIYGYRIGREYVLVAQQVRAYEETAAYDGPLYVIHGTKDTIVPYEYGERYKYEVPQAVLYSIPGEGHLFLRTATLDRILRECLDR